MISKPSYLLTANVEIEMLVERAIRKASTRDNKEVTPAVLLVRTKIVTIAGESAMKA